MQFGKALKEVKKLATGYYIGGIILSVAFFFLKITNGLCTFIFGMKDECGLDRREHEIMIFLAVMICYKNRKAANWMHCLANIFLFSKLANIFLFLRADLIAGIVYICVCLIHSAFYPEPIYAESDRIVTYNNTELYEEIKRNTKMTWLIYFYTSWSPECKHVSHVFARLSDRFHLPNLRFAKLDVGKWSQEANRFRINIHPISRQLPTISLFKEGKEIQRRPAVHNRRALPFVFTEENCILAFDLINLYEKCKSSMTKYEKEEFMNGQSKKQKQN